MAYRPAHSDGEGALRELVSKVREHMYLPDTTPLLVAMAAVVANRLPGPSVSLLVVGQASCGGTTVLQLVDEAPGVRQLNSLTSQALISGTSVKEKSKGATGGFLYTLEKDGATVLIPDLTRVLAQDRTVLADVMGMLRDVSDGKVVRPVGADGGREITWEGKAGILSKCTDSYDRHQADLAEFGDRFLLYRWPDGGVVESSGPGRRFRSRSSSMHAADKAIQGIGWSKSPIKEIAAAHAEMGAMYAVDWNVPGGKSFITAKERGRLVAIAELCAMSRISIQWDWGRKQIIHVQRPEYSARAGISLAKLFQALLGMEVERKRAWEVVRAIGMDSMPLLRSQVIQACVHATKPKNRKGLGKRGVEVKEIAAGLGNGREGMVRAAVEELWVAGVIEAAGQPKPGSDVQVTVAKRNWTPALSNGNGYHGQGGKDKDKGGRPADLWRLSEEAMDVFEKGWL